MHRHPGNACDTRERHLAAQQQHEGLKQQREARELARPRRVDLTHRAVGELHPRNAHLEFALVLEEVQMPIALGERVVDRMLPRLSRHRKAATDLEIHTNHQLPLARLEVHPGDVPGGADAQGCLEYLLGDHFDPSTPRQPSTSAAWGGRPPCGFADERRSKREDQELPAGNPLRFQERLKLQ